MFPRYFCRNGVSLTITCDEPVDYSMNELNNSMNELNWFTLFEYVNVSDISPPLEDMGNPCGDWDTNYKVDYNTYASVPCNVLMDLINKFGGILCAGNQTDSDIEHAIEDKKSRLQGVYKSLRKSTAKVYVRPLSKLQRVKARAGLDFKESHFLSIKYPGYSLPCAWRYSASEIWVERPWLDRMVNEDKVMEAFDMMANNTLASSVEEPLINHDKTVNTPVYRMPLQTLRELSEVYYDKGELLKILEHVDAYKKVIGNEDIHDFDAYQSIPVNELNFHPLISIQ